MDAADEFWWPREGSLREILAAVPPRYGIVQAFWRSFVPRVDDGEFFAERMTARVSQQAPINDPTSFYRPVVKVAHRADPQVTVGRGNHALVDSRFAVLRTWYPIEVLHFPLRSRVQWAHKVELQGVAFTEHIERPGTGYHLRGYDALREGHIEEQHAGMVVDNAAAEQGVADGTLVIDTRLRDALRTLRQGGSDGFALLYRSRTVVRSRAHSRRGGDLRGRGGCARRGRCRAGRAAAGHAGAETPAPRGAASIEGARSETCNQTSTGWKDLLRSSRQAGRRRLGSSGSTAIIATRRCGVTSSAGGPTSLAQLCSMTRLDAASAPTRLAEELIGEGFEVIERLDSTTVLRR